MRKVLARALKRMACACNHNSREFEEESCCHFSFNKGTLRGNVYRISKYIGVKKIK